ncbi:MAG: Fic family protein [Thiotrichaceae bacterium]|nr:Fic family protein [Thiotrichaceae bacterium]
MSYVVLTTKEQDELIQIFFRLRKLGEAHPIAREEALTALRCLKAIHSNAIEDKRVDRIFLQVLLHGAGVPEKSHISQHYQNASTELKGQEEMLCLLETYAGQRQELSISLLLEMHNHIFSESSPDMAGRFRNHEVRIKHMRHRPCHQSKIQQSLHQKLSDINHRLFSIGSITPENFHDVLQLSADAHYLVAAVHPFSDGNGRIARAIGDYVMLVHGYYYDVIMTDYRDIYLDSLSECSAINTIPLQRFIEYSYLETLRRISGFFQLLDK